MQEFEIDLGMKEIFSLKNFSFDILNNGSADLSINKITPSSQDITLLSTNAPIYIIQNTSFTVSGYLKILYQGDSTGVYYIDFNVGLTDQSNVDHTDIHRYRLNYNGVLDAKYTNILEVTKIFYIKNLLILNIEFDSSFNETYYPNIILKAIDNENIYILPRTYRVTDKIVSYIYKDNELLNKVINDKILFIAVYDKPDVNILNISYRSI